MIKSEFMKFFKSKKAWIVFLIILFIAVLDSFLALYLECKPENYNELVGVNNPAYFSLIAGCHISSILKVYHYPMPLYLTLAYCSSYIKEKRDGVTILQYTKQGRKKYFFSKMTVAFLVPIFIIGIPNLVNITINSVYLYGGTNFSSMQKMSTYEIGELLYFCVHHPYTTYFVFLFLNIFICGLLSVMCQSFCFIFKDNRIVYLLSIALWIGVFFSSRVIGMGYVLQPFVCIRIGPIINTIIAFIPFVFIPAVISYFCIVKKKDAIL